MFVFALFASLLSAPDPEPTQALPGPCEVVSIQSPTRLRAQCPDRAWTAIPSAGYAPQVGDHVTLAIVSGRIVASPVPGLDAGAGD